MKDLAPCPDDSPEVIYLQPECCAGRDGRLWAEEPTCLDDGCEIGNKATKYIRADRTPTPDLGVAVGALRRIKAKLQTGPTTQSLIMDAWDRARELLIEFPGGTLPREVFEGTIEDLVADIDEALKSLGGE